MSMEEQYVTKVLKVDRKTQNPSFILDPQV